MKRLRKIRETAQKQPPQVPLHPFFAGVNDDTPFWRDLPDILQAQLLVMLDDGRPTQRNPQPRPAIAPYARAGRTGSPGWDGCMYGRSRGPRVSFCVNSVGFSRWGPIGTRHATHGSVRASAGSQTQ